MKRNPPKITVRAQLAALRNDNWIRYKQDGNETIWFLRVGEPETDLNPMRHYDPWEFVQRFTGLQNEKETLEFLRETDWRIEREALPSLAKMLTGKKQPYWNNLISLPLFQAVQ